MARSAADATRFTATSPRANSKPSPATSSAQASSIPTTQETPQEKVARLRQLRQSQRDAALSPWERTIVRGRRIADSAHRATALGLIGLTVLCGGITAFAVTDMILHNRRRRNAFYAEQHLIYSQRLLAAVETEKAGLPLTDDQRLVLNRERAKQVADQRRKEESWMRKVKSVMLLGGLKKDMEDHRLPRRTEEEPEIERGVVREEEAALLLNGKIPTEGEILEQLGVDKMRLLQAVEDRKKVAKGAERPPVVSDIQQQDMIKNDAFVQGNARTTGGILDRIAADAADGLASSGTGSRGRSTGWWAWIGGGKTGDERS